MCPSAQGWRSGNEVYTSSRELIEAGGMFNSKKLRRTRPAFNERAFSACIRPGKIKKKEAEEEEGKSDFPLVPSNDRLVLEFEGAGERMAWTSSSNESTVV